ncbi:MAG: DUF2306 domain-containing protein [Geminicoccaceae bacterium]
MASTADPLVAPSATMMPGKAGESTSRAVAWATGTLALASWVSTSLFAAYILVFYIGALPAGTMQDWNKVLPRLYEPNAIASTSAMAVHLVLGAVLLILGPIQFVQRIRRRVPSLHRWIGRVYGLSALGAGLGGLGFVLGRGTVGGPMMSIGFGLYGALMSVAAVQAMRHAWRRRLALHRAWAIRLFALVIGSWLYRMDYGIWLKLAGGIGHSHGFDGPFDRVMDFFFFVPNLVVAELLIRSGRPAVAPVMRWAGIASLYAAAGFIALATFLFGRSYWIPHILARL